MKNLRRSLVIVFVALACALFATGCDDIIKDPNFHTWCGDSLCSWKLESGEIRKAPTWHKNDTGVELLDSSAASHVTAISQVVAGATYKCLEFSVIADVAAEAQVYVEVDFGADGTAEYKQQIAAVGFRVQKTQITAPARYTGMKLTLSKRGSGRAVLAQMDVKSVTTCSAPPVSLEPQALGTSCSLLEIKDGAYVFDNAACHSGQCCMGICSECCVSMHPPRETDGGLAPDPVNTCSDGATCGSLPIDSQGPVGNSFGILTSAIPYQCDPGKLERDNGKECILDTDCKSHVCDGVTWNLVNLARDAGCSKPPAEDPECNVSSVHGGHCR